MPGKGVAAPFPGLWHRQWEAQGEDVQRDRLGLVVGLPCVSRQTSTAQDTHGSPQTAETGATSEDEEQP